MVNNIFSSLITPTDCLCRNRRQPIGYKLSVVQFDGNGSPIALANSMTAAADIVSNPNLSACPQNCFRPVGLAWDSQGRLFMSSDATGEIYVVTKADGSGVADVRQASAGGSTPSSTTSGSAPSPTSNSASKSMMRWNIGSGGYYVAAIVGALEML